MRRYSILQAPALAFHSKEFYRDVSRTWRGASYVYLLLLLAVCWMPAACQVQKSWATFVDGQAARIVSQVPPITIEQGRVSVDADLPYTITDPETKRVVAILDTTADMTSLSRSGALVMLGKEDVAVRKSPDEIRTYRLSGVRHLRIDRDQISLWMRRTKSIAGPFVYLLSLAGSYLFRMLEVLLLAVGGIGISRAMKVDLDFAALLSVAVMAITPGIVLRTLLYLGGVTVPFAWLLFLLIVLAYMAYGVAANRSPQTPETVPPVDRVA
jgi:Protein of unknown function (DUF1189)